MTRDPEVLVQERAPTPVPASAEPDLRDRGALGRAIVAVLLVPVHLWRLTAPLRAPRCRFHPSCSTYAVEALRRHGALRGSALAARRLGRCHPWNPGGIDHVPPTTTTRGTVDA